MSSPERGGPQPPDEESSSERAARPYQRAARFAGERAAGRAYFAVQRVLYQAPERTEVSVFRLQLNRLWHVAALGIVPPTPVLQAIERILDRGERADLPAEVWQALHERRSQLRQLGGWIEGHHRPGQPL